MGSCISKCMPKTHLDEDYEFVHDKLVILQPPPSIKPQPAFSKPVSNSSNLSAVSNRSSSSIFSTSSCSSSLSTASSAMSPRVDRSFSNDFLLSCVKENPHIIHLGSTKVGVEPLFPVQEPVHGEESELPIEPVLMAPSKQYMAIPQRVPSPSRTAVQKRVRSSSPVIARQKSMRVTEPEGLFGSGSYYSSPARVLRSPSPSRRFGGGGGEKGRSGISAPTTQMEFVGGSKRLVAPSSNYYSKMNKVSPLSSSSLRKENTRVASPNNNPGRVRDCLSNRDPGVSHDTKMEEIEGKLSSTTVRDILGSSEDIDDPLIALDCFIFI